MNVYVVKGVRYVNMYLMNKGGRRMIEVWELWEWLNKLELELGIDLLNDVKFN